jgi:hypothetical protein
MTVSLIAFKAREEKGMNGFNMIRKAGLTLCITTCLVLSLCAGGWGNGEWHERAEKGYVGSAETSSVPGSIKEGSQPLLIAPPAVAPPLPEQPASAAAPQPSHAGVAKWFVFLAVSWLIAFVLIVFGVRMHLREQRGRTR